MSMHGLGGLPLACSGLCEKGFGIGCPLDWIEHAS